MKICFNGARPNIHHPRIISLSLSLSLSLLLLLLLLLTLSLPIYISLPFISHQCISLFHSLPHLSTSYLSPVYLTFSSPLSPSLLSPPPPPPPPFTHFAVKACRSRNSFLSALPPRSVLLNTFPAMQVI